MNEQKLKVGQILKTAGIGEIILALIFSQAPIAFLDESLGSLRYLIGAILAFSGLVMFLLGQQMIRKAGKREE